MLKKQSGFTLIELVVVIIVLGILAATAVPKFVDLQSDARVSALKGLKGALESAATLTYVGAVIDGEDSPLGAVDGVDTAFGYPTATEDDLREAAGLNEIDWVISPSGLNNLTGTVFIKQADTPGVYCGVTYIQSTSKGERPTIFLGLDTGDVRDNAEQNFGC